MGQKIPKQSITNKNEHIYEDLSGVVEKRRIFTEDRQDFFEPLVFKEKNECDHIRYFYEELLGHRQLRDRITCTPLYPDSLFICGSKKIFEYNRETNENRVIYNLTDDYNRITAIKAFKNYILFGDMKGIVRRLTLGSLQVDQVLLTGEGIYYMDMVNGFSFYEFDGKDYAVVAINSWKYGIHTYEVESLKLVHAVPIPDPNRTTCAGGVSVSPSNRFMIAVGDRQEIYVYEIVPKPGSNRCNYKIRETFHVLGNCHTAHWAPDESCFAVSSEGGFVYLFSFKVVSDTDLDVQLVATYGIKMSLLKPGQRDGLGIENVKFHPRPDVKLMAYAAANYSHVYVVDYSTLQIVQILMLPEEQGNLNNGIEFSPDGNNLYAIFSTNDTRREIITGQLLVAKSKSFNTLTELCLNYIRKHKNNWTTEELRNTLPESLFQELTSRHRH